jgi:hypothetical protein
VKADACAHCGRPLEPDHTEDISVLTLEDPDGLVEGMVLLCPDCDRWIRKELRL